MSKTTKDEETIRLAFDLVAVSGVEKVALLRKLFEPVFPSLPNSECTIKARIAPEEVRAVRTLFNVAAKEPEQRIALLDKLTDSTLEAVKTRAVLMVELLVLRSLLRKDPVEREGGSLRAEAFGKKLGVFSKDAIDKRRRSGELLAWKNGQAYEYPVFQIADGEILHGIIDIIEDMRKLGIKNSRAQILQLLNNMTDRDGKPARAIDLLRHGQIEEARDLVLVNRSH